VLDVIHSTEKVTGKKVAYEIVARREGDVVQAYADPKKSSEMLDWHPNYSLEDAIQDMWRFEMQKKSNDNC
jgi:UDP-glucose 4-epimerase